ncbi:porin [Amorphus sp. 3PC139-8]
MNLKQLLIGSGIGLLATTGVEAGDLPIAPEPIDYVRVCDAFGAGYYYIPGTDTCLALRGRVRAEMRYYDNDFAPRWRDFNSTGFRARGYVYMDSRTNTEFGLLRAYNEIWITHDSVLPFSSTGGSSTRIDLWNSLIQFGGFTFGKTGSFYDFGNYATWAFMFTPSESSQRQFVAAYTFAAGNGVSSSLSVESTETRRYGIAGYTPGYGGTKYPDLIANVRIDQGWGSAQLSGALHQVWPGYDATGATPGSEVGWGLNAGVVLNLPFAGAKFNLTGAYTQGAVHYASSDITTPLDGGDATWNPVTGDLDLATAWSVSGGLGFNFSPTVEAAIQAGYLNYEDGDNALNDFKNYDLQGNIGWKPVSGLLIGTEVNYRYVDAASGSGIDDGGLWAAAFRVQRTF